MAEKDQGAGVAGKAKRTRKPSAFLCLREAFIESSGAQTLVYDPVAASATITGLRNLVIADKIAGKLLFVNVRAKKTAGVVETFEIK